MAEIVFTITEVKGEVHLSAIISAEKTDSRLVKDTSNIIAPLMLACASAEIAKFFQHLNGVHHG
ncbi:hypothetical protein ACS6VG_000932 [Raoultella planticola]